MTRLLLAGSASADTQLAHKLRQQGYDICIAPERSPRTAADLHAVKVVLYGARDAETGFFADLPELPVIVLARNPDPRVVVSAMKAGAADYLVRPFSNDELFASVENACKSSAQSVMQPNDNSVLASMLGDSPVMQKLFERIRRVAPTQTPVLIEGEIGSGKGLVARAVHASSTRAQMPLVTMNCSAVPEALQEAELFGAAATNGATSRNAEHVGLIEAAHKGSLFLDDVAALTPGSQAKLLRVLQSGENRRLGASTTQQANVRIICACQRDLGQRVSSGAFREDLYYRLNVVSLVPPPLRDRGEDRIRLAEHFLDRSARKLGRAQTTLTSEAIVAINGYHWPGNVREMENAIERAVILASSNQITPELLAIDLSTQDPADAGAEADPNISLEDYFVKFVTENQDQCTETELAERLGISRKSLWERRQRLNIPRKRTKKRAPRRT